jgi:hypothetical protein
MCETFEVWEKQVREKYPDRHQKVPSRNVCTLAFWTRSGLGAEHLIGNSSSKALAVPHRYRFKPYYETGEVRVRCESGRVSWRREPLTGFCVLD